MDDLNLEISTGQILALVGASGCGKSTTLQMIAGITKPDQGSIYLAGQRLDRIPPEKRPMTMVMQQGWLFPHLNVAANVEFGLRMRGEPRATRRAKAMAMLELVQLAGFGNRQVSFLSGGQAQRVALARALVVAPEVLLLDEPLSALDANLRQEMQALILQLQRQTGITTILVTHDQREAVALGDRIAFLVAGRLRQVGTPAELYHQPIDRTTAEFFGGVNFWPAQAAGHQARLTSGVSLFMKYPAHGPITITIRPEQIKINASNQFNSFDAEIKECRFLGTHYHLSLYIDQNWHLQALANQAYPIGENLTISLPPEHLWFFPDTFL